MNYTQLTSAIKGFAEKDFTATVGSFTSAEQIARFVHLAEQRKYNSVQMHAFRKNVTGNTTSGNKYLATPVDWLATFSLAVINAANEYHYLLICRTSLFLLPTVDCYRRDFLAWR